MKYEKNLQAVALLSSPHGFNHFQNADPKPTSFFHTPLWDCLLLYAQMRIPQILLLAQMEDASSLLDHRSGKKKLWQLMMQEEANVIKSL